MEPGKKYTVFSIHKTERSTVWVRAGIAWPNKDGSTNVYLDVLPLDGKLHIREAAPASDSRIERPNPTELNQQEQQHNEVNTNMSMGGH